MVKTDARRLQWQDAFHAAPRLWGFLLKRVLRLLGYVQPYWLQAFASVVLMAGVGLLDAFRLLLVGPIFDRVLNPNAPDRTIPLLGPRFGISLQQIVPSHFHNAWDIVAFALVVST